MELIENQLVRSVKYLNFFKHFSCKSLEKFIYLLLLINDLNDKDMIKRGIGTAVGAIKRQLLYDKDMTIAKIKVTPANKKAFKTKRSCKRMSTLVLTHDVTEGAVEIKPKTIEVLSYDRPAYFSFTNEALSIVNTLSRKAFILFQYIINNIPLNHNYIVLSTDEIKNIINEKHNCNAYTILHELLNKNLIAKSDDVDSKNKYVICHNLFFKGNYNQFIYKYNKIYGESDDTENADD